MSRYWAAPYSSPDLPELIAFAQRQGAVRGPRPGYYHPGDVVWQLYSLAESDDVRIWRAGDRVVAMAIFEPPLTYQFDVDPGALELVGDILEWAEERRSLVGAGEAVPKAYEMLGERSLSTSAFDSDSDRIAWLTDAGYASVERGSIRFERNLDTIPDAPAGVTFTHIGEPELAERVDLHCDAWSVWGPSSFSLDAYRLLRAAPLYDPGLDVVLVHDGRMASYCICWLDEVNGVGYFEPVGTRPSEAGKGLGRAVMHEGLRRLRDRGMTIAMVATATVNAPAAALYQSAGFSIVDREHYYVKPA